MIIDTHFHGFPQKYLELLPEARNDTRGIGFRAFNRHEYLNVMDKHGIDIGVRSNTAGQVRAPFIKLVYDTVGAEQVLFGADYPHGPAGQDDQFYPMTLKAMADLDVPQADKDKIYFLNAKRLFGIN